MFSNYGGLSNEKLLFAYGFALPDNPFDAFAVKLKTKDTGMDVNTTFYLRRGGIASVPKVLPVDACMLLPSVFSMLIFDGRSYGLRCGLLFALPLLRKRPMK